MYSCKARSQIQLLRDGATKKTAELKENKFSFNKPKLYSISTHVYLLESW
ncbi:hypothetical protein Hanom_Chr02g00139161 [Helianthus anomalus]